MYKYIVRIREEWFKFLSGTSNKLSIVSHLPENILVPSVRISFSNIEHLPGETWFNFRNNKQPLAIKMYPDIIAPNETLCQTFKEQLTIKWLPMECT